jgi:hypothetical protein
MTRYKFNTLPYKRQLVTVFDEGTFLTRRWEEEDGINLYHLLGGFLVELYYDIDVNELVRLRHFRSAGPLKNYALGIRLPKDR